MWRARGGYRGLSVGTGLLHTPPPPRRAPCFTHSPHARCCDCPVFSFVPKTLPVVSITPAHRRKAGLRTHGITLETGEPKSRPSIVR